MTEEEKQKLNEKLARWAGFTFVKRGSGKVIIKLYGWDVVDEQTFIHYPDGGSGLYEDMTPFTDSLDACFKWLVPKVISKGHWLGMITTQMSSGTQYIFAIYVEKYKDKAEHEASNKDPALALCLASEKLIDNE